jgi:hypothetical protein
MTKMKQFYILVISYTHDPNSVVKNSHSLQKQFLNINQCEKRCLPSKICMKDIGIKPKLKMNKYINTIQRPRPTSFVG